jgi:dTDP-4-dehydrorhamnose 3,5-epimerase-like enzyme
LFDSDLGIDWPLPRDQMIVSDKDLANPSLSAVSPVRPTDR